MTGAALGLAVMPPLLYLSSTLTHESAPLPTLALLALFGMLLTGPSGLCWRLGSLLVRNLAVNIPQYLLPIFSLTWLAAAGLITVQSPAMLLPGMALVLTANLLISLTHTAPADQSPHLPLSHPLHPTVNPRNPHRPRTWYIPPEPSRSGASEIEHGVDAHPARPTEEHPLLRPGTRPAHRPGRKGRRIPPRHRCHPHPHRSHGPDPTPPPRRPERGRNPPDRPQHRPLRRPPPPRPAPPTCVSCPCPCWTRSSSTPWPSPAIPTTAWSSTTGTAD